MGMGGNGNSGDGKTGMGMQCWNGKRWEWEWEWFDGSGKGMGTRKSFLHTSTSDHNSTAVFTKFNKQVGPSPWKNLLDFKVMGSKVKVTQQTTISEIFCTPQLVNRWRDLNQNFWINLFSCTATAAKVSNKLTYLLTYINTYYTGRSDYVFKAEQGFFSTNSHSTTKRLKHSSNFESVENVPRSNVVEFEFELRHIPTIWVLFCYFLLCIVCCIDCFRLLA